MKKSVFSAFEYSLIMYLVVGGMAPVAVFGATSSGGGGMDTGGGNVAEIRKERLSIMLGHLKQDLNLFFGGVNASSITDPQARNAFIRLLSQGFKKDIQDSTYVLKNRCGYVDSQGIERESTASTSIGHRGSEICLNPEAIQASGASDADVYALVIHEHAHHLGYQEAEAQAVGNVLGDYVAAFFYEKGGPSRPRSFLPPSREKLKENACLNISDVMSYIDSLDSETPTWVMQSDMQIDSNPSDWYVHALNSFPILTRVTLGWNPITLGKFQQVGCKSVLMYQMECSGKNSQDCRETFNVMPIIEATPTKLVFEYHPVVPSGVSKENSKSSIPQKDSQVYSFSAPDGVFGNRYIQEFEFPKAYERKCKGDLHWARESHWIALTQETHIGESVPPSVLVSTRRLDYQSRGAFYRESPSCKVREITQ
jgi:hypothetical protein